MALASKTQLIGDNYTKQDFRVVLESMYDHIAALLGTAGSQAGAQTAMGVLFGRSTESKTGAYTVTTADRGKIFRVSGTWTLSLPAVATAGDRFAFALYNYGTGSGVVTIAPNGTELIDQTTLPAGASCIVYCTGSRWYVFAGRMNIDTYCLGNSQAVSNVTASRAFDTTYYNTTQKPKEISVTFTLGSSATGTVVAYVDGIPWATAGGVGYSANNYYHLNWIVGPGESYSASATGAAVLHRWAERG